MHVPQGWRVAVAALVLVGACCGAVVAEPAGDEAAASPAATPSIARTRRTAPLVIEPDRPTTIEFTATRAKFVRFVIHAASGGSRVSTSSRSYASGGKENLAAGRRGSEGHGVVVSCRATRSTRSRTSTTASTATTIVGSPPRRGKSGPRSSCPQATESRRVVFSRDREGSYRDRVPLASRCSSRSTASSGQTVREVKRDGAGSRRHLEPPAASHCPSRPLGKACSSMPSSANGRRGRRMSRDDHLSPLRGRPAGPARRKALLGRHRAARRAGARARANSTTCSRGWPPRGSTCPTSESGAICARAAPRWAAGGPRSRREERSISHARLAKRRLLFRDPDLAPLERILFVKRHPYAPSHNYSDILDSAFGPGGGVCVLEIPRARRPPGARPRRR